MRSTSPLAAVWEPTLLALGDVIAGHFQQWLSGCSVLRVVGATAVRGGLFVEARQLRHPKTT